MEGGVAEPRANPVPVIVSHYQTTPRQLLARRLDWVFLHRTCCADTPPRGHGKSMAMEKMEPAAAAQSAISHCRESPWDN